MELGGEYPINIAVKPTEPPASFAAVLWPPKNKRGCFMIEAALWLFVFLPG